MGKKAKAADASPNISHASVQVLNVLFEAGAPAPSVVLTVGDERLCFNCAEGFVRCCMDAQVRHSRLSALLLTRVAFDACGGVPSAVLACAEAARSSPAALTVLGPPKLGLYMNALAAYSEYVLQDLQLHVEELKWPKVGDADAEALCHSLPDPVMQTGTVTVHALLLQHSSKAVSAKRPRSGVQEDVDSSAKPQKVPSVQPVQSAPEHSASAQTAVRDTMAENVLDNTDAAAATAEAAAGDQTAAAAPAAATTAGAALSVAREVAGPADDAPATGGVPATPSASAPAPDKPSRGPPAAHQHGVAYLCKLPGKRGKLLSEKAKALGVKPGPDFGKLANGQAVTTASGEVVLPEQCMEPGIAGEVVAIVDCPHAAYLPALHEALPAFEAARACDTDTRVAVMVHLAPEHIALAEGYQSWLAQLPGWRHILASARYNAADDVPSLHSSWQLQARLHALSPGLFPLATQPEPIGSTHEATRAQPATLHPAAPSPTPPIEAAPRQAQFTSKHGLSAMSASHCKFVLRPVSGTGLVRHQPEGGTLARLAAPPTQPATGEASTGSSQAQACPRVTFLGTGAACPSKYRNVTAILFDFGSPGTLLADCGEGTWGQLVRCFGVPGAQDRLRRLQCVWVSHRHADHHAGLARVLRARTQLLRESAWPVPLFGPFPLRKVLSACDKIEPLCYTWHDQYGLCPGERSANTQLDFFWEHAQVGAVQQAAQRVCEALSLRSLESFLVQHCKHSFGLKVTLRDGRIVIFSGDTQRCDNLITAAEGAELLIHEATFESGMDADAAHKKHSTIADALEVAQQCKCKHLLMTHFSQRYPKVPVLSQLQSVSAGIAFDLMTLSMNDLGAPARLLPALQDLFASAFEAAAQE